MKFNKCQKDLIRYVINFEVGKESLTPCIEVFQQIFKEKYTSLEIEECARVLVSSGVLELYSFHSYFRLTETFKTSDDYNLFND